MNKKEIIRRYEALIEDVKTNEYYTSIDLTNRVNCYKCACSYVTKTIDKDAGVTPMFHRCFKCGLHATSAMYSDIRPNLKPVQEWYRPTLARVLKLHHNGCYGLVEHILNGGLDVRNI